MLPVYFSLDCFIALGLFFFLSEEETQNLRDTEGCSVLEGFAFASFQ